MNSLLYACMDRLYDLLAFITEDACAFGWTKQIPQPLMDSMNRLCIDLGDYLDKIDE